MTHSHPDGLDFFDPRPLALSLALVVLMAGLVLFGALVAPSHAQGPDPVPGGWQVLFPPYPSPNERFGFGLAGGAGGLVDYDVAQLGAGWYLNWGATLHPTRPESLVYVQMVRLKGPGGSCLRPCGIYAPTCALCQDPCSQPQTATCPNGVINECGCGPEHPVADPQRVAVSPNRDTIRRIAQANPGSVWLIGNEPDRIVYMDDVCPDEYAMVYHDLYQLIKESDPTAKVAIGGISQATPIRLQYLDIVMCAYRHTYGTQLPADLWNVHGFVLNEESDEWGADIPPGMVSLGRAQHRDLWRVDDLELFKQQIRDFRQWMADHGERDKPLIVSEYGVLLPSWLCDGDPGYSDPDCGPNNGRPFGYPRVTAFMQSSFDYFLAATDSSTGYPADGNRLVQAWNWYSLNEDWAYNGNLFYSSSKQITPLGTDFGDYVGPSKAGYRDLLPWDLSFEHPADLFAGDPVTVTISSRVFNVGTQAADNVLVRYWLGKPDTGTQLGGDHVLPNVPSRYQGPSPTTVVTWTTVATDTHEIYVQVDPAKAIIEADESNNTISATLDLRPDLTVDAMAFDPPNPLLPNGEPMTITIRAQVSNVGHLAVFGVKTDFWDGPPGGNGTKIGSLTIAPSPATPLGRDEEVSAQIAWTTDVPGPHAIYVRVDPGHTIAEVDEGNNQAVGALFVATDRIFMPWIFKDGDSVAGTWHGGDCDGARINLPAPTPVP